MPIFDLSGWNVKIWKYNSRNIEEQLHKKNAWIAKNYKRYQIEEIYIDGAWAIQYRRRNVNGVCELCCG